MKDNKNLFTQKMPSELKNKILSAGTDLLKENQKKHRRSFVFWLMGSALATISAAILYMRIPKNENHSLSNEFAQNIDIYEIIELDEDMDLLADMDLLEELETIEYLDEET